jgi:tetratricopeptide (TPR) repeat protein
MTTLDDPGAAEAAARALVTEGVRLCREGQWQKGLERLREVAASSVDPAKLPGTFYSYLGFGMAQLHGRKEEGLKLCQRAIEIEFYQADNYFNLARMHAMMRHRREAVEAIEKGLKVDPEHRGLQQLHDEIGERSPPVLRKLPRAHFLNRLLGKVRHDFAFKKK